MRAHRSAGDGQASSGGFASRGLLAPVRSWNTIADGVRIVLGLDQRQRDIEEDGGIQQARFEGDGGDNLGRTQQYARLFMVPGMYHCSGGPGPNVFDALKPLVYWVEKGVAPERIIASS
jgi:hypothetical protein